MLRGSKVALRPVEVSDVELLTAWWNDPAFVDGGPSRWPTRTSEVEKRVGKKLDFEKGGEFMIVQSGTLGTPKETPVGHIGFFVPYRFPVLHCLEIGFNIHPDHRGQGYATQAARMLIDRIFGAERVQRVQAHSRVSNVGSQRVLEQAGMTREGTLRSLAYLAGQYEDVHFYSILRPEWGDSQAYAQRYGGL